MGRPVAAQVWHIGVAGEAGAAIVHVVGGRVEVDSNTAGQGDAWDVEVHHQEGDGGEESIRLGRAGQHRVTDDGVENGVGQTVEGLEDRGGAGDGEKGEEGGVVTWGQGDGAGNRDGEEAGWWW